MDYHEPKHRYRQQKYMERVESQDKIMKARQKTLPSSEAPARVLNWLMMQQIAETCSLTEYDIIAVKCFKDRQYTKYYACDPEYLISDLVAATEILIVYEAMPS